MEKKNKETDDTLENLKFFQRGGQRMIRQNMAQTRAIDKNEADKTYDMMGLPSDPEDWQPKEFAGTIMQEAGIKPHSVWNIVRKNYWDSNKNKYSATLRFHFRGLACKKQLRQWFVKKQRHDVQRRARVNEGRMLCHRKMDTDEARNRTRNNSESNKE